jgi:hypothetical protein
VFVRQSTEPLVACRGLDPGEFARFLQGWAVSNNRSVGDAARSLELSLKTQDRLQTQQARP